MWLSYLGVTTVALYSFSCENSYFRSMRNSLTPSVPFCLSNIPFFAVRKWLSSFWSRWSLIYWLTNIPLLFIVFMFKIIEVYKGNLKSSTLFFEIRCIKWSSLKSLDFLNWTIKMGQRELLLCLLLWRCLKCSHAQDHDWTWS